MEKCGLETCSVCLHVTFIWQLLHSNSQIEHHYHDHFIPSLCPQPLGVQKKTLSDSLDYL